MRRRGFGPFRAGRLGGAPNVPPALQRANELMAIGNYPAAAVAFENLAHRAEEHGGPRAPLFYIQAGHARILMGQVKVGVSHLKQGLNILVTDGRFQQFYRFGQRAVRELKARGLDKESQEIAVLISANMPAIADLPTQQGPDPARVSLPTHCPACGGPLRSDEVDWVDHNTVECPFCGSPVRAV